MPGKPARKWQFARESRRPLAYGSIRRDGKDESMEWRSPRDRSNSAWLLDLADREGIILNVEAHRPGTNGHFIFIFF